MPDNQFDPRTSVAGRKKVEAPDVAGREKVKAPDVAGRKDLLDWLAESGWSGIRDMADSMAESLAVGGAVFSCGNGGSASQAEHFAAELAGRYKLDRKSLPVFALSTNSASVTAISNDFGYTEMFARQIEGIGKQGDCLLALSTSGNSKNIIRVCQVAREKGMNVFGFTGKTGGNMVSECDATIKIPETDTAKIQEMHLVALHLTCQYIEDKLFSPKPTKEKTS
ncbi:MAG: SIS domain-containing protein [Candidatus Latescibacterota bacterium]|nr:MAG: SIS domain-containing protein [Candidatus Latescibacterota bacterium]